MVYCSAFNCNNDGKKMKHLSFFQFPSDEKYRQIWKEKVRRLNWEPNKYSRLCSAHFEQHCYVHNAKLFESLGLPKPKKVILKPDAVPTIFDYEDRTSKPGSEPGKRKHEDSNNSSDFPSKGRKILEVIDFNSLLDDYLKGLQSEEELNSFAVEKGSDELVNEIIPGSSPCEGGDKFVLLLNKPLPEDIDDIKSSLLCVRFGSGHVVPVTLLKEQVIRGEHIPRSEKPGVVAIQLETNDGRVLGSTTFIYKEEICTGFQKILCSTNYRGKFFKAFSNEETKKGSVANGQHETQSDVVTLTPSESSLALTSILRLMLYMAAKKEVAEFVEDLFKTKAGKAVVKSFKEKECVQEDETVLKPTLQHGLTAYLENISTRLTAQEQEQKAKELEYAVKIEEMKKAKFVRKAELQKRLKPKEVKIKASKKLPKVKKTSSKKLISGDSGFSQFSDMNSKTNSLLLLSDIALRHLSSEGFENGTKEDISFSITQRTSSTVPKKDKKSYQSRNALKFTRKIVLLPRGCTCLPSQGELLKIKTSSAVNQGSVHLENDMTAADVLQQVRTALSMLGKKRIRLAAADSKGKLEFFKATKWTGRNIRQRIKFNSVLYVVPS